MGRKWILNLALPLFSKTLIRQAFRQCLFFVKNCAFFMVTNSSKRDALHYICAPTKKAVFDSFFYCL
jgi:hypothetical protein